MFRFPELMFKLDNLNYLSKPQKKSNNEIEMDIFTPEKILFLDLLDKPDDELFLSEKILIKIFNHVDINNQIYKKKTCMVVTDNIFGDTNKKIFKECCGIELTNINFNICQHPFTKSKNTILYADTRSSKFFNLSKSTTNNIHHYLILPDALSKNNLNKKAITEMGLNIKQFTVIVNSKEEYAKAVKNEFINIIEYYN